MLSSQTKDQITSDAMKNLREYGLTIDNVLKTDETILDKLICKVGFHKKKAKYIKQVSQILKDKYDKDIPRTIDEIIELPGVGMRKKKFKHLLQLNLHVYKGPKMGMLLMQEAWNE